MINLHHYYIENLYITTVTRLDKYILIPVYKDHSNDLRNLDFIDRWYLFKANKGSLWFKYIEKTGLNK